jgi:hypothetical protein
MDAPANIHQSPRSFLVAVDGFLGSGYTPALVARVWRSDMSANRATLELQELGDRALPSPVILYPTDPIPPSVPVVIAPTTHPLQGTGMGSYREPEVTIDAGTSFTLHGTAHLRGLGEFHVTGHIQSVGMIAGGRATGELVLTNGHGTITLALHGPIQQAFGSLPRELVYTVVGGTKAYSHLSGYGTLGVTLTPAPVDFGHAQHGSVALNFS